MKRMAASLGWLYSVHVPTRHRIRGRALFMARRDLRRRQHLNRLIYATASSRPESKARIQTSQSKIWLPNERYTYILGRLLAEEARPGDVLLLHGELGAGKTSLARGYIHAARRDNAIEVTSPSYLLTNVYPAESTEGPLPAPDIYHMDLWRLDSASDRPLIDFGRVFAECVSLIEWPERLKDLLPSNRLDVMLEYPPPVQKDDSPDDSDPWGFGTGDDDDPSSSRTGRFVSLNTHEDTWDQRVENLFGSTDFDEAGRRILPVI